MLICPKCNKEQEEGAKFCDACGTQLFETIYCPNCGEKTSSEFTFCEKCGASVQEDVTVKTTPEDEVAKRKNIGGVGMVPKKTLIGGGIAIVAILLIVLVGRLFVGGNNQEYCLYVKDGEFVYDDFSEDGSFEITSRLLDNTTMKLNIRNSYEISEYVKFSEDGKSVFYPDKIDDEQDGFTLYWRNVSKKNEDPIKIDSELESYETNAEGNRVIYLKWDGDLYIHDLKDREKIASDVSYFYVADDCEKVAYLKQDGEYYVYSIGKESEKIASDVEDCYYVSDDLSEVYYIKEDGLYKQVVGEEDYIKIASDVCIIEKIYDSGEVYYIKEDIVEVKLIDYVFDDMADADAVVTKPERSSYPNAPERPYRYKYDSSEAYDAAKEQYDVAYEAYKAQCAEIDAAYNAAYDAYNKKLKRDSFRETIKESTLEYSVYTLYYYDGKESQIISDAVSDLYLTSEPNTPMTVYSEYSQVEVTKVNFSEIASADEVRDLVREAIFSSTEKYLAVCDKTSLLEQTDAVEIMFANDGKSLYFLDDVSDAERGDLYKASIVDNVVQKPEIIDSDVADKHIYEKENTIIYFKNYDSDNIRGDLWVNGKEVDYDVYLYDYDIQGNTVYYLSDYSGEKECGTLKMYSNGKTTKIADDVYSWTIKEDKILYLYDYSWKSYGGALYIYEDEETEKITDDVSCIIK